MDYIPPIRNFENIQFGEFRKTFDIKYNNVHDELTDCYYNKKPYKTYGILNKKTFDKLHALIFLQRDVDFHQENLKQLSKDRIPEEQYNDIKDIDGNVIGKKDQEALSKISTLKTDGIELEV